MDFVSFKVIYINEAKKFSLFNNPQIHKPTTSSTQNRRPGTRNPELIIESRTDPRLSQIALHEVT